MNRNGIKNYIIKAITLLLFYLFAISAVSASEEKIKWQTFPKMVGYIYSGKQYEAINEKHRAIFEKVVNNIKAGPKIRPQSFVEVASDIPFSCSYDKDFYTPDSFNIFIFSAGLLNNLGSDGEIAAVFAREIALSQIKEIVLRPAADEKGSAEKVRFSELAKNSPEAIEIELFRPAMGYLAKAGYDPQDYIKMFDKLKKLDTAGINVRLFFLQIGYEDKLDDMRVRTSPEPLSKLITIIKKYRELEKLDALSAANLSEQFIIDNPGCLDKLIEEKKPKVKSEETNTNTIEENDVYFILVPVTKAGKPDKSDKSDKSDKPSKDSDSSDKDQDGVEPPEGLIIDKQD